MAEFIEDKAGFKHLVVRIPNYRPKKATALELKRAGLTLLNESNLLLKCDSCGQTWSPNIQSGGRLPRLYWQCPKGCNKPE